MAGKGGGAWKVAYADFATAMMAFFMVMWITAQNKPVKESVARYFEDPFGSTEGSASIPFQSFEGAATVGPFNSNWGLAPGSAKSKTANKEGVYDAASKEQKPVIYDLGKHTSTGTMLLFADDSAELNDAAKRQLKALLPEILGKPNVIEIRGHASRRPLPAGTPYADVWQLSYARCTATMKFLTDGGIVPDRVRLSQAGASEPYTLRRDPDWQLRNSRVEVYVLNEYAADREEKRESSHRHGAP